MQMYVHVYLTPQMSINITYYSIHLDIIVIKQLEIGTSYSTCKERLWFLYHGKKKFAKVILPVCHWLNIPTTYHIYIIENFYIKRYFQIRFLDPFTLLS